jgi:RimJ/RimL family protein N-acetyltransferase
MIEISRTGRLLLRHIETANATAFEGVFCDPEVMHFGDGAQTPEWVRTWAATRDTECYTPWGFGPWAVTRLSDGAVLGYCGLFLYPDLGGRAEIELDYRLAQEHWRRARCVSLPSAGLG